MPVCPSIGMYVTLPTFLIPAVKSQNVTNKSCFECVKSEKYVVWVTLRPIRSMKRGEVELCTLQY